MTAIAYMPDSAAGNGTTDDTSSVQAPFDACPVGGLVIIPDGVFRVTDTIHVPRPMNVWCSPGAHIKGDFAGTGAVVHAFWHTPDGTSDLYVAMESFFWQGGPYPGSVAMAPACEPPLFGPAASKTLDFCAAPLTYGWTRQTWTTLVATRWVPSATTQLWLAR